MHDPHRVSVVTTHPFGRAAIQGLVSSSTYRDGKVQLDTLITVPPDTATPLIGPRYDDLSGLGYLFAKKVETSDLTLAHGSHWSEILNETQSIMVVGWPRLIAAQTLSLLRQRDQRLIVGMHPAPLPSGRGLSPVSWTVLRGLQSSAVTVFDLQVEADSGNIRLVVSFGLQADESATSVYGKALHAHFLAGQRLADGLRAGEWTNVAQDPSDAKFWRRLGPADRQVGTDLTVSEFERRVRAFGPPYEGAASADNRRALLAYSLDDIDAVESTPLPIDFELVTAIDGSLIVQWVESDLYERIAIRMAKMSSGVLEARLSKEEPDRIPAHRYSGVVLETADGSVLLQQREMKRGIVNPGMVTLFGGVNENGESDLACAVRELQEELALTLSAEDLDHLGFADKLEEDGSITRCAIYWTAKVDEAALRLLEGKAIIRGTPSGLLREPDLSAVCRLALEAMVMK